MAEVEGLLSPRKRSADTLTVTHSRVNDGLDVLAADLADLLNVTGAGVMLLAGDRYMHVASSLPLIAAVERVVEAEQRGPTVEAGEGARPVVVRDVRDAAFAARFTTYAELAKRSGLLGVAALPMIAGDQTIGVLDLYDENPREWSEEDLRVGRTLASIATGHAVLANNLAHHRQLATQLQQALDSRIVIEQAKGIVAVQRGLGLDQAFALLRKRARDTNRRLHDVCAEVAGLHRG